MSVAIPKGTKLVCPLCGSVVGEAVNDLMYGEVVRSEDVLIYGVELKNGDELRCPKCGFPIGVETLVGSFIHTEEGWMPLKLPTRSLLPDVCRFLKLEGEWKEEWDKLLGRREEEERKDYI